MEFKKIGLNRFNSTIEPYRFIVFDVYRTAITIYKAPFRIDGMDEEVKKFYVNFDVGVHHIYIGNVVRAWIKESSEETGGEKH